MKTLSVIFFSILLGACGENASLPRKTYTKELPEDPPVFEVRDYRKNLALIEKERAALGARHETNGDPEIIENARLSFVRAVYRKVIPFWYETEWDFYGTSETPRQGKIACGYFVTTVLRDAGLKVERSKLAQQASEKIILSLTKEEHVKRFRRAPLEEFIEAIEKWGEGLYVVGLDFHVGFIVNDGRQTYFIHSSYIEPRRVVKESAAESAILDSSKYRVVGKISADDELLTKWLRRQEIPTK